MQTEKNFLTTGSAASLLGVSLRTVQMLVNSGQLKAWKTPGGHRRIPQTSIVKLLEAKQSVQSAGTNPEGRFRVLVVEDDPALLKLYEFMLSKWPMAPHILTASDGIDALNQLEQQCPDLMIADLNVPGVNGFELIKLIKKSPRYACMTLVAVSGLGDDILEARKDILNEVLVLTKPIPFETLKTVACYLERTRSDVLEMQTP